MRICYMAQQTQTGSVSTYRDGMGREMSKQEGTYVYMWLTHGEVWQKTAKFCKAIILQYKKKGLKMRK